MSWRIEHASPFASLCELPDGLCQTGILRMPRAFAESGIAPILRELHRVTRDDGTLWLFGAAHAAAALEAGWHRPTSPAVHPRLRHGERGYPAVTLLAKRADFYLNRPLPVQSIPRRACGQATGRSSPRQRRRAWCVRRAGEREVSRQLIDWCLHASTSPRSCQVCGAPWRRHAGSPSTEEAWRPGCEHGNGRGRCLVLDPFCETGETGIVAVLAGRSFLGIEQDLRLARCAQRRLATAEAARQ
jgi:hypothetical protein